MLHIYVCIDMYTHICIFIYGNIYSVFCKFIRTFENIHREKLIFHI